MVIVASLPGELLSKIFDYIDSIAQLAACRLVCRGWNYLAERSMFGKEIRIKSEKQAIQVYTHLCRNPFNGNLIKSMHLEGIGKKEIPPIFEYLMDIAFTPTMEELTGLVYTKKFFNILVSIAERYSLEFVNLKRIPKYAHDNDGYMSARTLKQLQASALSIDIQPFSYAETLNWKVIKLLDKFKYLRSLELKGEIDTWSIVDPVLKKCHTLETLTFYGLHIGDFETSTDRQEVHSWVIIHKVIKEFSLKAIEFKSSVFSPPLIEYLMYKYPNVTKFTVTRRYLHLAFEELQRIMDSIKRVQYKELTFILQYDVSMWEAIAFAEFCSDKVEFHTDSSDVIMKIS